MDNRNYKKTKSRRRLKPGVLLIIIAVLIAVVVVVLIATNNKKEPEVQKAIMPNPQVVSTATIGATGDILIHDPVFNSVAYSGYDFNPCFEVVAPYFSKPDLMLANLEVTCGGEDYGAYCGYPIFNCPDTIVSALANAGVDVCLTANNHSYDTGYDGMLRTLDIVSNNNLGHLGTRKTNTEPFVMVKQINGIKIGMVNYTYDTRSYPEDQKSLNGITMRDEAQDLVNSFCYSDLNTLYSNIKNDLHHMDMVGADVKVVFLHWGDEYTDYPNDYEEEISQQVCELGADVIIGGHPHVVQEYRTLHSSTGHECLCLYSMGNEISNQRRQYMDGAETRGYTEDGLIFEVTISKFNNGKSKITGLRIIPTWVQLSGGQYTIIALDNEKSVDEWGSVLPEDCIESYNRTLDRLSDEYNAYRIKKKQSEEPKTLG